MKFIVNHARRREPFAIPTALHGFAFADDALTDGSVSYERASFGAGQERNTLW